MSTYKDYGRTFNFVTVLFVEIYFNDLRHTVIVAVFDDTHIYIAYFGCNLGTPVVAIIVLEMDLQIRVQAL